MSETKSIIERIAAGADDAPAIAAPERSSLTHGGLRSLMAEAAGQLNARGVGRGDRVAIVLPNGPEMATAFLAVAATATTAPLNPAYRADELDFYLTDIGAKAILVAEDETGPAVAVAERLGIGVVRLDRAARRCRRHVQAGGRCDRRSLRRAGLRKPTTSRCCCTRPAPRRARNWCRSATPTWRPRLAHIGATLGLTADDRCLNIMPLFHIHGLIAAVLSSLAAGGSVFCTPGFNALRFFQWLGEARPSWYTAVPTMHQAILARAARNPDALAAASLRFIRSSSASLPPQVMAELEATFGCPVIESYGMTEAAHQMASNRLPPGMRKAGSVGAAAGPEVAIMAPDGQILKPGQIGEIVIRGPNVTSGYEKNPDANASAFAHGWFHTGDQGVLDEDFYLARHRPSQGDHQPRRREDLAARGRRRADGSSRDRPGASRSPCRTTSSARRWPPRSCCARAVPRPKATSAALRPARLADFKVPRRIVILDEIPKGATGKLQRIGLAAKLGLG